MKNCLEIITTNVSDITWMVWEVDCDYITSQKMGRVSCKRAEKPIFFKVRTRIDDADSVNDQFQNSI